VACWLVRVPLGQILGPAAASSGGSSQRPWFGVARHGEDFANSRATPAGISGVRRRWYGMISRSASAAGGDRRRAGNRIC